jgi:hypothetical protein
MTAVVSSVAVGVPVTVHYITALCRSDKHYLYVCLVIAADTSVKQHLYTLRCETTDTYLDAKQCVQMQQLP